MAQNAAMVVKSKVPGRSPGPSGHLCMGIDDLHVGGGGEEELECLQYSPLPYSIRLCGKMF